jgi:hypothetical protein
MGALVTKIKSPADAVRLTSVDYPLTGYQELLKKIEVSPGWGMAWFSNDYWPRYRKRRGFSTTRR